MAKIYARNLFSVEARLRKLIGRHHSRLLYLDHLEHNGSGLYAKACEFDLEGISREVERRQLYRQMIRTSWLKIKNPTYSQAEGREELFDRV